MHNTAVYRSEWHTHTIVKGCKAMKKALDSWYITRCQYKKSTKIELLAQICIAFYEQDIGVLHFFRLECRRLRREWRSEKHLVCSLWRTAIMFGNAIRLCIYWWYHNQNCSKPLAHVLCSLACGNHQNGHRALNNTASKYEQRLLSESGHIILQDPFALMQSVFMVSQAFP